MTPAAATTVKPYPASVGCLTVNRGGKWLVVGPAGYVLSRHDREDEARNQAMFNNLTATDDELREWQR